MGVGPVHVGDAGKIAWNGVSGAEPLSDPWDASKTANVGSFFITCGGWMGWMYAHAGDCALAYIFGFDLAGFPSSGCGVKLLMRWLNGVLSRRMSVKVGTPYNLCGHSVDPVIVAPLIASFAHSGATIRGLFEYLSAIDSHVS